MYTTIFQLLGLREREREDEIKPAHIFLIQVLYLYLVFYRIGPHRCLYSSTATVLHIYSCNDRKITTHTISRITNALFPLWGHSWSGKIFLHPWLYLNSTVCNYIVPWLWLPLWCCKWNTMKNIWPAVDGNMTVPEVWIWHYYTHITVWPHTTV